MKPEILQKRMLITDWQKEGTSADQG